MRSHSTSHVPEVTTADLLRKLEEGIEATRSSESFQAFLRSCARFHKYSFANTMLIALQRPQASQVAGFQTWLSLGRHVRKGEKAIRILAPIIRKVETEDGDDAPERRAVYYKTVSVFDVSQTDGDPLPEPVTKLAGDDCGLFDRLAGVVATAGLVLDMDASKALHGANGYYVKAERRIWIDPELEPLQRAKTLAHELSHHYADHPDSDCRGEKECVAEASAFVVMASLGIDSGQYSFGYLASWTDSKTFKAKLAEIQRTAHSIVEAVNAG